MNPVHVQIQTLSIPTYQSADYEQLPMFAENRVHQRSSGNPYPNPVINRVCRDKKNDKEYEAIILENRYIQLMILPEIGGRIFGALDKTNHYDFFYRQHVIKPALIGMLGSWISGGVEFNWPIHHRPSTYLPVDYEIEHADDGSVTVWLSEHEPLDRMKGMVGISLHPDRAVFETKMRVYNRTYLSHSFLWWENAAVPVNPDYQVFFPQDVTYVCFHYKKAAGAYPVMDEFFNVQDNRGGVDIRYHKNTADATSYFCGPSKFDFFGGYDHGKKAGVIHVASHHTSVGKKMFTWGYNQLSRSWEDTLTDNDGAYAELMASSYSDNQPDFTWLEPFETKTFSQFWYPFKEIGEPQNANCRAALHYEYAGDSIAVSIYPTESIPNAKVRVAFECQTPAEVVLSLEAAVPAFVTLPLPAHSEESSFQISLLEHNGLPIISYRPPVQNRFVPEPRNDNPSPNQLQTADDCYHAGVHIAQYRDPAVQPDVYWKQGLALDPNHAGCLNALGAFYLDHYCWEKAEEVLRRAVTSLTRWNPNPKDTEAFYHLGLALKAQQKLDDAYEAFHKSIWNRRVIPQSLYCIAQIDCIRKNYTEAHKNLLLIGQPGNQKALCLLAAIARTLGESKQAEVFIRQVLTEDPLDYFALNERRRLSGEGNMFAKMHSNPAQTCLDIAFDYADAGFYDDARELLLVLETQSPPCASYPMIHYALGYFFSRQGSPEQAIRSYKKGASCPIDYCFPSRAPELEILMDAVKKCPDDAHAFLFLGNLLYGKKQYGKGIKCWERSCLLEPSCPQGWRNLSLGEFNRDNRSPKAMDLLKKAIERNPGSLQLSYEQNLLAEMQALPVSVRLDLLQSQQTNPAERDDLYLQSVRLQNQLGNWENALKMLSNHLFIPCEGGEHAVAEQYTFAHFALGRTALLKKEFDLATEHFVKAQTIPINLGGGVWHKVMKAPHLYYEGISRGLSGNDKGARTAFEKVADLPVNYFTNMYLPSFRYYRGLSLQKLGAVPEGTAELTALLSDSQQGLYQKDYGHFSTTPYFHSYWEKPEIMRKKHFSYLCAMAYLGLGSTESAKEFLEILLSFEPDHLMGALEYHCMGKS